MQKTRRGLAMRTNGYAGYDIYYSPEDMIFALKMDYAGLIKGLQAKNPPRLEIFDPHKTFLEYRKTVVAQREKRKEEKEKKLARTRKKLRQPGRIEALRRRFTMGDFMDEIEHAYVVHDMDYPVIPSGFNGYKHLIND